MKLVEKPQDEAPKKSEKFRALTVFFAKISNPEQVIGAELFISDNTLPDEELEDLFIADIALTKSMSSDELVREIAYMRAELSNQEAKQLKEVNANIRD